MPEETPNPATVVIAHYYRDGGQLRERVRLYDGTEVERDIATDAFGRHRVGSVAELPL